MKTYNLTMEDIKNIYRAGCRRGEEETVSHEWGSSASGKYLDNLEDVFHDILNKNVKWGEDGYIDYNEINKMIKE